MTYSVERMRLPDIPDVQRIEVQSFSSPWSAQAYERDLSDNRLAHYVVLRELPDDAAVATAARVAAQPAPDPEPGKESLGQKLRRVLQLGGVAAQQMGPAQDKRWPIVAFAGIWMMLEEAHLVTIAVSPAARGKGLGELTLVSMIDLAVILGATEMTLEVRVSNHVAQGLYRKYGFAQEGLRRRYYSDNGEDALIMTAHDLTSGGYQGLYQPLKEKLAQRVKAVNRL